MSQIEVKALRAKLGMTQADLADAVGVDQATVSNWETGKTTPGGPAIKLMMGLSASNASARSPEKGAA